MYVRVRVYVLVLVGEGRVNENVALTTLHTLFSREHNRIEGALHHLNPHWDGETLYQVFKKLLSCRSVATFDCVTIGARKNVNIIIM